jgi:hypothetical protein
MDEKFTNSTSFSFWANEKTAILTENRNSSPHAMTEGITRWVAMPHM